jgi:hypothetical protein
MKQHEMSIVQRMNAFSRRAFRLFVAVSVAAIQRVACRDYGRSRSMEYISYPPRTAITIGDPSGITSANLQRTTLP